MPDAVTVMADPAEATIWIVPPGGTHCPNASSTRPAPPAAIDRSLTTMLLVSGEPDFGTMYSENVAGDAE